VFCGVFQIGVEKYIYLIIYCKRGKNFQWFFSGRNPLKTKFNHKLQ
jgi:hypothetical protein